MTTDDARLYKYVAGTRTVLDAFWGNANTFSTEHEIIIVLSNSSIKVYVDGILRLKATDTFNQSATKHGLATMWDGDAVYFDDFSISPLHFVNNMTISDNFEGVDKKYFWQDDHAGLAYSCTLSTNYARQNHYVLNFVILTQMLVVVKGQKLLFRMRNN